MCLIMYWYGTHAHFLAVRFISLRTLNGYIVFHSCGLYSFKLPSYLIIRLFHCSPVFHIQQEEEEEEEEEEGRVTMMKVKGMTIGKLKVWLKWQLCASASIDQLMHYSNNYY